MIYRGTSFANYKSETRKQSVCLALFARKLHCTHLVYYTFNGFITRVQQIALEHFIVLDELANLQDALENLIVSVTRYNRFILF